MWLTVKNGLKAGSNGVLSGVTLVDTGHVRYEWKERFPIDYYLISLSVAPYVDYSYYMHFSGSTDSMLIQNYVYDNPATLPFFKNTIDSTGMMVDYLSKLYGRYPFWQEKYGHCMAPLGGGMEHQTMTTLGYFEGSIVAHELGHQWFGDHVTCGTWADITMNEGFASYTEDLFIDHFRSHSLMLEDMQTKQTNVKSFDTGTVYADDTVSEGRIFDDRLTYNKGACMLHMLRSVVNNDSAFFQVYKTYQQDHGYDVGTIEDFRLTAKTLLGLTVNGINLDTFFNQWAYLQGFPEYTATWNQIDSDVYIKLVQTTAVPSSVPFFTLPVEFKFYSGSTDTLVRVNNTVPNQEFHFVWPKAMVGMDVDPNFWLVYKLNNLSRDPNYKVGVPRLSTPSIAIAPNPAKNAWHLTALPAGSQLRLTDISGQALWHSTATTTVADVPAADLAPGIYLLSIVDFANGSKVYKLVKE
jgi:aminopeptidase N